MADDPDKDAIYETCFVCQRPFRLGPSVYNGRLIPAWGEMMCDACINSNWDGIVPETHTHVIPALEAKGIKVTLNKKGWLDIPK